MENIFQTLQTIQNARNGQYCSVMWDGFNVNNNRFTDKSPVDQRQYWQQEVVRIGQMIESRCPELDLSSPESQYYKKVKPLAQKCNALHVAVTQGNYEEADRLRSEILQKIPQINRFQNQQEE